MEKEFIPYQEAFALKELGFDEPCFGHYLMKKFYLKKYHKQGNGITLRPTYSQAFRFFREKYSMHGYVEGAYPWFRFYINWDDDRCEGHKESTYEEAELACVRKLIEIVKLNNNDNRTTT
jgi:hypothetical protein